MFVNIYKCIYYLPIAVTPWTNSSSSVKHIPIDIDGNLNIVTLFSTNDPSLKHIFI